MNSGVGIPLVLMMIAQAGLVYKAMYSRVGMPQVMAQADLANGVK